MRILHFVLLSILVVTLTACVTAAEQVMPPLQYKQPVGFHVPKTAYLYWQSGQEQSSIMPQHVPSNSGVVGALIGSLMDAQMRKSNPERYTFTYGKAQQAVFMTSLKNTLEQDNVFNNVELVADLKQVKPKDVLIIINFKTTRVAGEEKLYQIALSVEMTIQTGKGAVFKRNYFVQSQDAGVFSFKTFKEQQTDVSQQLLNKVIEGIKQWYSNS